MSSTFRIEHLRKGREMDNVQNIVTLLIAERTKIDNALEALGSGVKRRREHIFSELPESIRARAEDPPVKTGRRKFTRAQKLEAQARMNKYWAGKRREAGAKEREKAARASARKPAKKSAKPVKAKAEKAA